MTTARLARHCPQGLVQRRGSSNDDSNDNSTTTATTPDDDSNDEGQFRTKPKGSVDTGDGTQRPTPRHRRARLAESPHRRDRRGARVPLLSMRLGADRGRRALVSRCRPPPGAAIGCAGPTPLLERRPRAPAATQPAHSWGWRRPPASPSYRIRPTRLTIPAIDVNTNLIVSSAIRRHDGSARRRLDCGWYTNPHPCELGPPCSPRTWTGRAPRAVLRPAPHARGDQITVERVDGRTAPSRCADRAVLENRSRPRRSMAMSTPHRYD